MLNHSAKINYVSRFTAASGATLVEFSIVTILLVAFTGLIFDLGIGMQRYGELSGKVIDITRSVASKSCGSLPVPTPEQKALGIRPHIIAANSALDSFIQNEVLRVGKVEGLRDVKFSSGTAYASLHIGVQISLSCMFCTLMPGTFDFYAASEAMLEDNSC